MKLNLNTSHPSAFISSTFIDLKYERESVEDRLKERNILVNALDVKPASNQTSRSEILTGIRESDFIILIIADRYGSILKSMTGSCNQSITWWEYNQAFKMGKPALVYFKNPDFIDKDSHDDRSDRQYTLKRSKFKVFKNLIKKRHNPAFFDDEYQLSEKLDSAIIPTYRNAISKLLREKTDLSIRLSELEQTVQAAESPTNVNASSPPQSSGLLGLLATDPDTTVSTVSKNPIFDLTNTKKTN